MSHNHAKNDVLNMEYGEFVAYLAVIQEQEKENLKRLAIAVRMANVDSSAFMEWLEK